MLDSRLPLFYAPDLLQNTLGLLSLSDANAHHALQVLRLKTGDKILLTNGLGSTAEAAINAGSKKACSVVVEKNEFVKTQAARRVAIGISQVKNASRFEWFLEKATELGVAEIYPMLCQRTERLHFRYDRMHNICVSAMLQSQQAWLPNLHQPISFEETLSATAALFTNRFIAHCMPEQKVELSTAVTANSTDALLLIGPEGDFTTDEIALALAKSFAPVALGATRLRTETAGVAGAALLCLL